MAVWSEVELDKLDRGRFDAEYYQPIYIKERSALRALETIQLGEIAFITDGQHGYHIVDEESEIKHITARCIANNIVTTDKAEGLGLETHLKNSRSALEAGDVLIQTAGTVGNAGVVTSDILPANIDQDVARVHIYDQETFSPWFVSVFINSELGNLQTKFESTGQVQQHLSLGAVRKLLIPVLSDSKRNEVADLAIKANNQRTKSKTLYQEAEALLLHELGLDTLDLSDDITYERNFDEVAFSGRFDAQFFQPKYYQILEAINKLKKVKPLSSLIEPIKNGFDFREYGEEGTPYIRVANVRNGKIYTEEAAKINITSEEIKKDLRLRIGDVLFTRKGSFGNSAVVRSNQTDCVISSEIMLLRLVEDAECLPDYLSIYLESLAGFMQIERYVHGVSNFSISQPDLARVLIALPSTSIQEKITFLVQESLNVYSNAKQLLEDAKRRVEDMILGE